MARCITKKKAQFVSLKVPSGTQDMKLNTRLRSSSVLSRRERERLPNQQRRAREQTGATLRVRCRSGKPDAYTSVISCSTCPPPASLVGQASCLSIHLLLHLGRKYVGCWSGKQADDYLSSLSPAPCVHPQRCWLGKRAAISPSPHVPSCPALKHTHTEREREVSLSKMKICCRCWLGRLSPLISLLLSTHTHTLSLPRCLLLLLLSSSPSVGWASKLLLLLLSLSCSMV